MPNTGRAGSILMSPGETFIYYLRRLLLAATSLFFFFSALVFWLSRTRAFRIAAFRIKQNSAESHDRKVYAQYSLSHYSTSVVFKIFCGAVNRFIFYSRSTLYSLINQRKVSDFEMSGRKKDVIWHYYIEKQGKKSKHAVCKKYGKEMQGLTSRMKSHFNNCSNNSDEDVTQNKSAGTYNIIV